MNTATPDVFSPQNLLLILLVGVAIWAVVELALFLRQTRRTVGDLAESVNETIGQVQPIIGKLDAAIDELQPTLAEVDPLVEKVELAIDEANVSLAKVNGILGDVSEMSETASSVTSTVKSATTAAANGVASFVDRMTGATNASQPAIAAPQSESIPASEAEAPRSVTESYITYGAGTVTAEDKGAPSAKEAVVNADKSEDSVRSSVAA